MSMEKGKGEGSGAKAAKHPLMKFWGEIAGRRVVILVATGASHSRIAKRVVEELGLPVCGSDALFDFGVGGPAVKSGGLCRGVTVKKVHEDLELEMTHDFYVFESLGGNEDIVLGCDWVHKLGGVYMSGPLTMKFEVAGMAVTLKGDPSLTPHDEFRISVMTRVR